MKAWEKIGRRLGLGTFIDEARVRMRQVKQADENVIAFEQHAKTLLAEPDIVKRADNACALKDKNLRVLETEPLQSKVWDVLLLAKVMSVFGVITSAGLLTVGLIGSIPAMITTGLAIAAIAAPVFYLNHKVAGYDAFGELRSTKNDDTFDSIKIACSRALYDLDKDPNLINLANSKNFQSITQNYPPVKEAFLLACAQKIAIGTSPAPVDYFLKAMKRPK